MVDRVVDRLAEVHRRIDAAAANAGRDPADISLVAISKKQPVDALKAAINAGQRDFGENYLQEALPKIKALTGPRPVWHFVGDIQSNKTAEIAAHFDWVHTVDRAKIARRLSAQRPAGAEPLQVCIQVNVDKATQKSGVAPTDCSALAAIIKELPGLRLRGLMTLPEPRDNFSEQRRPFAELARLQAELNTAGHQLDVLSMGMTADLEAAIAESATHLRIGTAVFGPRNE